MSLAKTLRRIPIFATSTRPVRRQLAEFRLQFRLFFSVNRASKKRATYTNCQIAVSNLLKRWSLSMATEIILAYDIGRFFDKTEAISAGKGKDIMGSDSI